MTDKIKRYIFTSKNNFSVVPTNSSGVRRFILMILMLFSENIYHKCIFTLNISPKTKTHDNFFLKYYFTRKKFFLCKVDVECLHLNSKYKRISSTTFNNTNLVNIDQLVSLPILGLWIRVHLWLRAVSDHSSWAGNYDFHCSPF